MGSKNRSAKYMKLFIYLVAIVLINVAGMTLFYRIDLTKNKIYSISKASKNVVSSLSEPLTINVFFTKNLPAPHNNTERYLHDLLEEYAIHANKYFNSIDGLDEAQINNIIHDTYQVLREKNNEIRNNLQLIMAEFLRQNLYIED